MTAVMMTFGGFPRSRSRSAKRARSGGVAHGGEGGHAERLAQVGVPAADDGLSAPCPRLPGDRGEAGQFFRLPGLDPPQPGRVLAAQQRQAQALRAVAGGGAVLDQRPACDHQLVEIAQIVRPDRRRLQRQRRPHPRQHRRIRPVGLGAHPRRLAEPFGLARIDLDDTVPGRVERPFEGQVIAPRRLEDHPRRGRSDPALQPPRPRCIVAERGLCPIRRAIRVQPVFRDVEADDMIRPLSFPCLSSGARSPGYPFGSCERRGRP